MVNLANILCTIWIIYCVYKSLEQLICVNRGPDSSEVKRKIYYTPKIGYFKYVPDIIVGPIRS